MTLKAVPCFWAALSLFAGLETTLSQQASGQVSSYSDERCAFLVRFGADMKPVSSRTGSVITATVIGQGFRISAACIPNPGPGASPLPEGKALYDRLATLAATLRVTDPVIRVPAPPAASCGLIEGTIAPGGVRTRVRAEFCYGPHAYLIVETTTDGSSNAEDAVTAVLASIAPQTDKLPKIQDSLSPVEK